ncbi:hypothetical protein GCM10010168_13780 [Actinoplanes ianthinogenes]|uniref:Uncharacterized protein n=1 Tax=Actinoplanes ianthinogenes TaxID=122358 RepID=A0ABN6CG65_9ACTN|nr:hypothetical protein [Actinoplanes ianthinogenes]BCJ44565.1 hypothetical protein Aiant_52220 [Actinoplanes ianthinogenes]GGQ98767.1 hypothetical protein GCM10010168_13780 [Actinoplanes ianthinogenes]
MTTPQPAPAEGKPIGQYLTPLRDLAAYVLVGAPAVFLFTAVIGLFRGGVVGSFGGFVNLATIVMPPAAVLLAHVLKPVHPKARLITLAAVIEYAVMGFFGVIFGLLFSVIKQATFDPGGAFLSLLVCVAWLAVYGLVGYGLFQVWRGLYMVPKPATPPGVYGRPQYGTPYGQPPAYGAPQPPFPAQPGPPPAAYGQPAPPPATYGQPAPAPSFPAGTYGQPTPPPAWNQPPVTTPPIATTAPPASAPPAPASAPPAPASAPPAPASAPPAAASALPPPAGDQAPDDRTSKLPDDRPGFGPAAADPPRQ